MPFSAKQFAGSHCGCRYQQDYRPTLGRDGKKESGTLEVIKFYYDGAIRFEQHCYGEAATFVFGVWASGMDSDGTPSLGPARPPEELLRRGLSAQKAGSRGRGREPLLRRLELPVEAGRRFRGGQTLGLPPAGRCCWES